MISEGGWNTNNPRQVLVGNGTVAVTKMVAWTSMLFCGCGDNIVLFNPSNFEKVAVCVVTDPKAAEPLIIQCMLVHGNSLLASLQLSAIVKCYNAVTHDLLYEIDITPTINTIFHGKFFPVLNADFTNLSEIYRIFEWLKTHNWEEAVFLLERYHHLND